ncbi:hypothetical protein ACFL3J_01565 [Candidatus Omnitrophota bacterium]
MDKRNKVTFGSKISKWQDNFMNRHPAFFYITTEVVAELLVACVLALFAFHMLPPDLNCMVSKKTPHSTVLSITNEGFLFASGEYGIETKKPLKKEPEVIAGKKYVDSLERRSNNSFGLRLSGLPFKKQIKIKFKTDYIMVEEE